MYRSFASEEETLYVSLIKFSPFFSPQSGTLIEHIAPNRVRNSGPVTRIRESYRIRISVSDPKEIGVTVEYYQILITENLENSRISSNLNDGKLGRNLEL